MVKIEYVPKRFNKKSQLRIAQANDIIAEFVAKGFQLTLRQLYYQFVARDLIPNNMKSYKALGGLINDARLAGEIDWESIEDRTRNVRSRSHWEDPADVIASAAYGYGIDLWEGQPRRVEVWIEKDALIGVIERVCTKFDVPHFSCRGYTSQSELWRAAQRHMNYLVPVSVVHLGDHDPSGIDMTRDIQDRLRMFGADSTIERIALNIDQVRQHKLPPNPAKATDSRFEQYRELHGEKCWELDALDPTNIEKMIESAIKSHLNPAKFKARQQEQEQDRDLLKRCSARWERVVELLEEQEGS
jgi:hypothetical protein